MRLDLPSHPVVPQQDELMTGTARTRLTFRSGSFPCFTTVFFLSCSSAEQVNIIQLGANHAPPPSGGGEVRQKSGVLAAPGNVRELPRINPAPGKMSSCASRHNLKTHPYIIVISQWAESGPGETPPQPGGLICTTQLKNIVYLKDQIR